MKSLDKKIFICSTGASIENSISGLKKDAPQEEKLKMVQNLLKLPSEEIFSHVKNLSPHDFINFKLNNRLFCAEAQPLYLYGKKYIREDVKYDWQVILFGANNLSTSYAKLIGRIIKDLFLLSKKEGGKWVFNLFNSDAIENFKNLEIDATSQASFMEGIKKLYDYLQKIITYALKNEYELVFNPTGAYKPIIAYLNMFALMEGKPTIYSYEENYEQLIELPILPIDFDVASIDEYAAILKTNIPPKNIESYPPFLKSIFIKKDGNYRISPWKDILYKEYEKAKGFNIGYGRDLLKKLEPEIEEKFEHAIKEKWVHIWIGDQIPETVEHSIRHSKRLLEFTVNLLNTLGSDSKLANFLLQKDILPIYIGTVYLHDIGHTIIKFKDSDFPIPLFPSVVRELHSFFSEYLIKRDGFWILKEIENFKEWQKKAIALISRYHRGFMRLKKSDNFEMKEHIKLAGEIVMGKEFEELLKPLEEEIEKDEALRPYKEDILLLAALLRFIDGTDVQSDRIVSPGYWEMREKRTEEEASYSIEFGEKLIKEMNPLLWGKRIRPIFVEANEVLANMNNTQKRDFYSLYKKIFETYKNLDPKSFDAIYALGMLNKYVFKKEQFRHFKHHSNVGAVLPEYEGKDIISIKIIPREDNKEGLTKVKQNIYGEFLSVKDTLSKLFTIKMEDQA